MIRSFFGGTFDHEFCWFLFGGLVEDSLDTHDALATRLL